MYQLITHISDVQIIQLQEFFPDFLRGYICTDNSNMSLGTAISGNKYSHNPLKGFLGEFINKDVVGNILLELLFSRIPIRYRIYWIGVIKIIVSFFIITSVGFSYLRDLLTIISSLTEKGVEFVSLKENIDTTTPHGRFMLTVFGALAELERENILERQHEGIEIAKAEGKYKGRKPVAVNEAKFRAVCARWRTGEITATAAMQEVGLKPNTFYRRVKEMGI